MLVDHDVFIQAVKNKKKVILTFFSGQQYLYLTRLCVPVQFTSSEKGNSSKCYYFWDSEADVGERLLALKPSQITYMELSDETFDPADYIIPETNI
jgi:hypothetical protein